MPRVSIRKLFIYFLAVASCLLLAINIQQRTVGMFSTGGGGFPSAPGLTGTRIGLSLSGPGPSGAGPKSGEEVDVKINEESVVEGKTDKKSRRRKALGGGDLDPSDLTIPEVPQRPWYMQVIKEFSGNISWGWINWAIVLAKLPSYVYVPASKSLCTLTSFRVM